MNTYSLRHPQVPSMGADVVDGELVYPVKLPVEVVARMEEAVARQERIAVGPEVPLIILSLEHPAAAVHALHHAIRNSPPTGIPIFGWKAVDDNGVVIDDDLPDLFLFPSIIDEA